jgi:hypothetical protein
MRKPAVLLGAGAAFFALVAIAVASVTPTVTYNSPISQKTRPKPGKPANITYTGILDVHNSDGTQPDTAPITKLYFAKQFINNARYFPSCKASQINGKAVIPAKCKKAQIGQGTATSQAGSPGAPTLLPENLTVRAFNGSRGRQLLLVLFATAPVPITNRVIPGTISRSSGQFGYIVTFRVPSDLQRVSGFQVALTHFNVKIGSRKTVTVRGRRVSYLQLKSCPRSKKLPVKAVLNFNNDAGQPGGPTVPFSTTTPCKR